jgi:Ig-like domain from next to BRCA1 gene
MSCGSQNHYGNHLQTGSGCFFIHAYPLSASRWIKVNHQGLIRVVRGCFLPGLLRLFLVVFLSACQNPLARNDPPVEPFYPPTRLPQTTPAPLHTDQPSAAQPTFSTIEPTPTLECSNVLAFAADLTIPDGTQVKPGDVLEKRWQVRNSGTCNWDKHYRLVLVGGPGLGVASEQALFPARSGTEAKIRIVFTAPAEPGTYRSAWQAIDPSGQPFGDLIFIEIIVEGE